jgi:hypothetical protein
MEVHMRNLVAVLLPALAVACGGGSNALSLSARAGSAASTSSALSSSALRAPALTLSNGITVDRLRLVIRKLELERASATPDDATDLQEFEAGPFLLDLSAAQLSGSVQTIVTTEVPAGTYRELKFELHKPDASEPGVAADPNLAALAAAQQSLIVDGTIDGQPFTFTSSVDAQQEFEGTFDVSSGAQNITLNIDVTGWFGGSGSARLDPRVSNDRSQIENNIHASFRVFDDEDRDGREDHQ